MVQIANYCTSAITLKTSCSCTSLPPSDSVCNSTDLTWRPCDAYAVIYALYPHICSSDTWCADLELGGKNTRGTLLIDWYRVQSRASERKNVVIVKDMNREQLRKYFAGVFIEKRKTMD